MAKKVQFNSTDLKNEIVPIGFFAIIIIVYLIGEFHRLGDFKIFLDAGELLERRDNIYIYNDLNSFKYYYSPLFALFLSLFVNINDLIPILIWKLFNFFFIYRIWVIINERYLDLSNFSIKQKKLFQACIFLSSFVFVSECFHLNQMTIFLLYAFIEGVDLIHFKQRYFWGALLIAIAINIKIIPIVIIPYFIFRNMIKPTIYIILISIILLVIPAFFIGIEYNSFLHIEWWKSINPLNQEHIIDVNERGLHSLSSFFSALFTNQLGNEGNLQYKRNILDLAPSAVFYILNITRAFLILYTIKIMNYSLFKKVQSNKQLFYEISYILLITPLIFPHQQIYGFLLVIPAIIYITNNCFKDFNIKGRLNLKSILFIVSVLIYSSVIILGFMKGTLYHYKVFTYGILLLLIVFCLYPLNKKVISK